MRAAHASLLVILSESYQVQVAIQAATTDFRLQLKYSNLLLVTAEASAVCFR